MSAALAHSFDTPRQIHVVDDDAMDVTWRYHRPTGVLWIHAETDVPATIAEAFAAIAESAASEARRGLTAIAGGGEQTNGERPTLTLVRN